MQLVRPAAGGTGVSDVTGATGGTDVTGGTGGTGEVGGRVLRDHRLVGRGRPVATRLLLRRGGARVDPCVLRHAGGIPADAPV